MSSKKRRSMDSSSDEKHKLPIKIATKIQPHRQKILIGKAYRVETGL
jgi:hypothetical protein